MFAPGSVVTGRPFRVTMGLRPLDPATWLEVDDRRGADLAEKEMLLAERHDEVVATMPAGDAASAELLDLVVGHLARHHPRRAGAAPAPRLHPVDAAGRLVAEDLCVMGPSPAGWRLVAASVCFPSRWRLADKIGRTLREIHDPVPGYEAIAAATDALFDRLDPDRPLWRTNWSILPSARLFQDGTVDPPAPDDPGALTLRVERQTLRRLPETGAAAFTIRTHRTTLADLVRGRPGAAADLAATLRTVPPATIRYKGWTDLMAAMCAWLEASAQDAGG